jgi:hypothetical protein
LGRRRREREFKRHTLFGYHMREALREKEGGQGKKDRRERESTSETQRYTNTLWY